MSLKYDLDSLKEPDIYSLLLFTLYKLKNTAEYSTLSELAYLFNKEDLLTLCELYGGRTITIPTINELQQMLNSLLIFQKVDIEHQPLDQVLNQFCFRVDDKRNMLKSYEVVKTVLNNYNFNSGR